MKPTGDLRVGGMFSFEGNASGEILRCEPPRLLTITWVYGEPTGDEVELRLSPGHGGETLALPSSCHFASIDPRAYPRSRA